MAYIKPVNETEIDHEPELEPKRPKSFMEYYADPAYRAKHLAYMKERVQCPGCGLSTARGNMVKHKRSKRHQQISESKKVQSTIIVKKELDIEKLKDIFVNVMKEYVQK